MKFFANLSTFCVLLLLSSSVYSEDFSIAAPYNFLYVLKERLLADFGKTAGYKAALTGGTTTENYTRIKNGEKFDIFLAGDMQTPKKLEEEGIGVANTRFTYAFNKIVLWSAKAGFVKNKGEVLYKGNFNHIAILDPNTAAAGIATEQILKKLNLWDSLKPKMILFNSSLKMHQAITQGDVELGFLPLSLLKPEPPKKMIEGSLWVIPQEFYELIEQQAILLKQGENNKVAREFLIYLKSPQARAIIDTHGYSTVQP